MHRLRPGDWLCGLGAVALGVLLLVDGAGWGSAGWLTLLVAAGAILAGVLTPVLIVTRESPSAPLLTSVAAFIAGLAAGVALLVEGADVALVGIVALVGGAYLSLHDERAPGARDIAVERRPAPH